MKLDQKAAEAYAGRGRVRLAQLNYDGAFQDLTLAVKLDPRLSTSFMVRGFVLMFQGNDTEAERDFAAA